MDKVLGSSRWSVGLVAVLGIALGCSPHRTRSPEGVKSALATSNGFARNGLTTNGIWTNGIWTNGIWTNGIWTNGLTGDAAAPGNALRASPYARQLLQYVYECAMPATTYDTSIDPYKDAAGNGSILCSTSDACGVGYACSADGKCVVPLKGAIGLAVNDDGSTWWGDFADPAAQVRGKAGQCDESCQRWVSACVLARTNAYGVHVNISMRAPANPPPNPTSGQVKQFAKVRAALTTTQTEVTAYSLREGAFYGNLFATTPLEATTGLPAAWPGSGGPATGPIASTPSFYACAGPDSNTPQVTKRFCSSQGDQSVITVPGTCLTTPTETGACGGMDPSGSIYGCYTSTVTTQPRTRYDEVITVYLTKPMAVCGNDVCESGEDVTTEAGYCPNDCRSTSWAKSLGGNLNFFNRSTASAIDPIDGSTVLAGIEFGSSEIVVDNTVSPPITLPGSPNAYWHVVLIKYDSMGNYLWGKRFPANTWRPIAARVAIAEDQSIYVVGRYYLGVEPGAAGVQYSGNWFTKFEPDGTLVTPLQEVVALTPTPNPDGVGPGHIELDSNGDAIVSGTYIGATTFGTTTLSNVVAGGVDVFVEKICGKDRVGGCSVGDVLWAVRVGSGEYDDMGLGLDGNDDILMAGWSGRIYKLSSSGAQLWSRAAGFNPSAVASNPNDPARDVYVTGSSTTGLRISKFSADGVTTRWVKDVKPTCLFPGTSACTQMAGLALTFDGAGNVLTGGSFGGYELVDFGAGALTAYRYSSLFVSAHRASNGAFVWAKGIPMVLGGPPEPGFVNSGYLSFGHSQDRILLSGGYAGSMQVDGRLLVSKIPESTTQKDVFVGSFQLPSVLDVAAPTIGAAKDQTGQAIDTVPSHILVQATSTAGAQVFFMPPTAMDSGASGATVACVPPPNTTFKIGDTEVTCTAADPLGNRSTATFTVTVSDGLGPIFSPVETITKPSTNGSGVTVTYTPPVARDQIDGLRQVSCTPPSGSTFPVGMTTVTCTSTDKSNNESRTTFAINVTGDYGAACTSQADCALGSCVDGVCCNTTASSCGQCQACNVPGSLGTCAPSSGAACDDHDACTQADSCQNGTCQGGTAVTCAATDQCHVAGTCNPSTGACSNPVAPNGTSCSDGNACTQADSCQAGTCTGANPVTCAAGDQCHVAGTCNPATGACSNPAAPNGKACSDGNACTQADTCQAGACTGANPVNCVRTDQCHEAGTCNPATGTCSAPSSPDGKPCNDGNFCTQTDTCQAGACAGANPVVCVTPDQCHVAGVCNPANGLCVNPVVPNGISCSDGISCTTGDVCTAGVCVGGAGPSCDDHNPCTVDACDEAAGGGCVHTPGNAGTVCRAAAGVCDVAETCSGTSAVCPADAFAPTGTICQAATNVCENPGKCTGAVATCPGKTTIPGCGVDTTPPIMPTPPTVISYLSASCTGGVKVTYTKPVATDAVDGVRPVTCTPASGSTFKPGKTSVVCTASDKKGNASSVTFTVWVQYQAPADGSFFLAPIRANGSSIFRVGRPLPVRFKLTGASAGITNLEAKLTVTKLSSTIQGTVIDTSDETVEDSGMVFKYRSALKWYAYRWKTSNQTQGTYQVRADLGDGVTHQINVSLKSP